VRFGSSDVATSGHLFFNATVLAGCSDQGHDFLTAAYDHVRLSSVDISANVMVGQPYGSTAILYKKPATAVSE